MSTPPTPARLAAGRDGHRAHLPARPARHGRRRRHERLRRSRSPASWPRRGIEVDIFTRPPRAPPSPPSSRSSPGVVVRHVAGRPLRGPVQGGPARPAVRLRRRRDAGRGARARRATTTSCTRTTGSPARSAGSPPTAGACRSCTPCTRWPGSRTCTSPTATCPEPRGPRDRRGPGRRGRRPARRQHRRARPDELVELYGADPDRVAVAEPGRRPRRVHAPASQLEARAAVGLPADAVVLLFVGRIQPLKAPDVLVGAPPSWCAGAPTCASRLRRRRPRRGRAAPACAHPMGLDRARRAARHRRPRPLRAAGRPRRRSPQWYRAADVARRALVQRVVRAGRRRGAGLRHPGRRRQRRRPAHRGRRRPACSSTGTTPPTGPPRIAGGRARPRPPGRPVPRRRRARRRVRLGAHRRAARSRSTPTRWPGPARRRSTTPRRSPASRTAVIP